ncbi:helix-turn-helix domain-containing protein [Duganella sp. FT80W]|uniref:Helix-turn-helix domain-containing protein n=1 Tax=Duganella guangzhouensis TaxID=2666084 RepID=A0A6I2KWR9_9BURK|nr:helix-turn-helix domain-containing protein [Duganella guangzhouensis]
MSPKRKQPPLVAVGAAIKSLRLDRGLTQEGLAAAAGLNLSYVAAVERADNNPTLLTLVAIASALGVSVEQLLGSARV